MASKISPAKRKECEALIYKYFNALDTSGVNTDYYKEKFAKMSDDQFYKFISSDFPFRFQMRPFKEEPTMVDIMNSLKVLNVPLTEKLYVPYLYKKPDGTPVTTNEAMVVYIHIKKVQQFVTKKNAMSVDISQRDMKTGLLVHHDKNGMTSDREMEALLINNCDATVKELSKFRADSMESKMIAYNDIGTTGKVKLADLPLDYDDSLSKNLTNVYLLGAMIKTNIINEDYSLKDPRRANKISRSGM